MKKIVLPQILFFFVLTVTYFKNCFVTSKGSGIAEHMSRFSLALTVHLCHENKILKTWPRGYKAFSCSTQLSIKFIMLMNVKMPTIVGILTFISMINTTSENLKESEVSFFQHFSFYEQLTFIPS